MRPKPRDEILHIMAKGNYYDTMDVIKNSQIPNGIGIFHQEMMDSLVKRHGHYDFAIQYAKENKLSGELEILYHQKIIGLVEEGEKLPLEKRTDFYNNNKNDIWSMKGFDGLVELASGLHLNGEARTVIARQKHFESKMNYLKK